jgi:hypothetical protein
VSQKERQRERREKEEELGQLKAEIPLGGLKWGKCIPTGHLKPLIQTSFFHSRSLGFAMEPEEIRPERDISGAKPGSLKLFVKSTTGRKKIKTKKKKRRGLRGRKDEVRV